MFPEKDKHRSTIARQRCVESTNRSVGACLSSLPVWSVVTSRQTHPLHQQRPSRFRTPSGVVNLRQSDDFFFFLVLAPGLGEWLSGSMHGATQPAREHCVGSYSRVARFIPVAHG